MLRLRKKKRKEHDLTLEEVANKIGISALPVIGSNALQANTYTFGADMFSRFIEYTDREETTMKGYITCLRQFMYWLQSNHVSRPERRDILAYKEYLNGATFGRSGTETLKASTKQQYLRAVKHFFKWTAAEGIYPNIADNIHGAKVRHDIHKKDALDREAVKVIADAIETDTEAGKRLYAMYLLCISCGLRTVEISRANVEDIKTTGSRTYLYLQGKGHSEHDQPVLLIPEVKAALQDYVNFILWYRAGEITLIGWPNCTDGANDFRIARECLLFWLWTGC